MLSPRHGRANRPQKVQPDSWASPFVILLPARNPGVKRRPKHQQKQTLLNKRAPDIFQDKRKTMRSRKCAIQAHDFCCGRCSAASVLYRTARTMLVSSTGCIHLYIDRASLMRLVPICQSFLVTVHRTTQSSAMLRNLYTIIEQTPSAKGSTHTATQSRSSLRRCRANM